MKVLSFILIFSQAIFAQSFKPADILVYSRSSENWNVFLLDSFQILMNNLNQNVDPYYYVEEKDISYDKSTIDDFVSDQAAELIGDIETASGLAILNLQPELKLKRLGYSVERVYPQIVPYEIENGYVGLNSSLKVKGITGFADSLNLGFAIKDKNTQEMISVLEVVVKNPRVKVSSLKDIDFNVDLRLKNEGKFTSLEFSEKNDFSKITSLLQTDNSVIDIEYGEVEVPEVELSLMGRELLVNANKIKEIIESNKEKIKQILVDQIRVLFEKNGAREILKHFDGKKFKNDRWIMPVSEKVFPIYLGIEDYFVPKENIFGMRLAGDFCTTEKFKKFKENCISNRDSKPAESLITESADQGSKENILQTFDEDKDISLALSVSEDYINKVIATTIDFGLWNKMLEDVGLKFADKGAQIRINKEGGTATLYLDVLYKLKGLKRSIMRGRKYRKAGLLRFPVTLDVTVRVENMYEAFLNKDTAKVEKRLMPHIVFNVFDVDMTEENFYGIEKYGLPSTINNVKKIFKKTVIKMIRKELIGYDAPSDEKQLIDWKGTDIPAIALPEIANLRLDKVDVQSDGKGRFNLLMRQSKIFDYAEGASLKIDFR